ncbi:MAG: DUF1992 domain-containing protein [Anaerolineaceae bacterium]|nr:DUF1992 domain-containing protein [Anaerolineaceae bacterium]
MLEANRIFAEEKIKNAIQTGDFENLDGQGKPARLEKDVYIPPDKRIENDLIMNNNFTLDWIEEGNEINTLVRQITIRYHQLTLINKDLKYLDQTNTEFQDEIDLLNKRIFDYNLRVPNRTFSKNRITLSNIRRSCSKTTKPQTKKV